MIVDTMVMAYTLLGVDGMGPESAAALRKADELAAPASVEAELLSVFWQWGREELPQAAAAALCADAARLWDALVPVGDLWPAALALAFRHDHSPYDTLFVAAARARGTRVLTYDRKLLKRFPDDAVAVPDFLR